MASNSTLILAESTEKGNIGICHLKRLWGKAMAGADVSAQYGNEWALDNALIDILGLGLLPTYQFLYAQKPSFETFEQWVLTHTEGVISAEKIQQCHNLVYNITTTQKTIETDVLTEDDIAFWDEYGYVVVKNAISKEDCDASRRAIWDYLDMDENDAASWYKQNDDLQGIMVPLYKHVAIEKNRHSDRIRRAFEQLWNSTDLIVTADKCGFNPPETSTFKYRGTGLHWDVSLAMPIPFGTQGILYLTDTAANQGALTVVPSFHKILESWLYSLPAHIEPRATDFAQFNTKPIATDAGDFIIWNHKLPHSSSPNRAKLPRLVQYINWYAPSQNIQNKWI